MSEIITISKETFTPIASRFTELVDEKTFKKEVSFALQHLAKNPSLKKCDPNSLLSAVLNVAQVGLTLNPVLSEAYLIPRWTSNGTICVLEPSYIGLTKLVTDTGSVKNITCYVVYKDDHFKVVLGTSVGIDHEPAFKSKEITHVYAVAELPDGTKTVEVMTIADCHDIREKSESYKAYKSEKVKTCVWIEWEQEMCRKSCIKRLVKYLPKTERWEQLREVIALDNEDYELDPYGKQASYIGVLMENSTLDELAKVDIEQRIAGGMSVEEASKLIEKLKNSQLNPISDKGGVGGEKEIIKAVKERVERED